jgi:homoaconitase/3-isopropylmalate dehydratase large subunit
LSERSVGEELTVVQVTGQTWFKVPETVRIRFIGEPHPGIGGKDVILYILKELRRNTVASDRVVEFTGPGAKHLSGDARFAICNMCTEFGAITGVFVPDEVTYNHVNARKNPRYKSSSTYCTPDNDAEYAESYDINLDEVEPFIAKYPNPDDVVPVTEMADTPLDGCFIGACTTAEEDVSRSKT